MMEPAEIRKFHFVGIGGIGMSGLAELLLGDGYEVSGSDLEDSELLERLRHMGARISIGHNAGSLQQAEAVVFSSAVPRDSPELVEAENRRLPVIPRGELLAQLMGKKKGITIAGTHGKTTTTSMIGLLLLESGLDPTIVIGALFEAIGSNARRGEGEWFVAEADESDRSFLRLSPFCSVVTNIGLDHMDEYRDLEDLQKAFLEHMNKTSGEGLVVACGEDANLAPILKKLHRRVVTYGLEPGSDICARKLELSWLQSSYDCYEQGNCLGRIELPVPGRHNILNSLAAVAVGRYLVKLPFETIQRSLAAFRGVERRLQWKGEKGGVWVIDDYGHHPEEIRVTLEACRVGGRRTVVVFQPHRYSRTQHLMEEMSRCFADADSLYLMDIYPAGEDLIAGITSERLAKEILRHRPVRYIADREELLAALNEETKAGDLLLTLGAGNVWKIGEAFLESDPD